MKIVIEVIPHSEQRYPTVGDWYWERPQTADDAMTGEGLQETAKDNTLHIKVSELKDARFCFLIALHELVEAALCTMRGITQESIDKFDMSYQGDREPGDEPNSPYHREHTFATSIERLTAEALWVDWWFYNDAVDELPTEQPSIPVSPSEDDDIPF